MTIRASGNHEADANSCAGSIAGGAWTGNAKESLKSLDRSSPVSKNWFPGVMTSVRQGLLGRSYFYHCRLIEESQGVGVMLPFSRPQIDHRPYRSDQSARRHRTI